MPVDLDQLRTLAPALHVSDGVMVPPSRATPIDATGRERFAQEGFLRVPRTVDVAQIADAIRALVAAGFPATCAYVFDEVWLAFAAERALAEQLLGGPV